MEQPHPQPTARHPGHLRARRLRGRRHTPPTAPPSHHTSQARTGGTKTTAKKTQHSNSTLTEIGTNLTRLNATPKQIGNLWDDTDTDSAYVYSPSTTSTATSPTPPHPSNTQSATSRTSYAARPPTTTRTSETILQRRGVDKNNAPRVHL